MPKPKLIPDDYETEILRRAGAGESPEQIAAWLSLPDELNRPVSSRRVREFLEKKRKQRAPITQAIIEKRVSETVTSDLDAVDKLLVGERDLQDRIGRLDAQLDHLERVARSSLKRIVDDKGRFIPLKDMDDADAEALAGVDIEQAFSGSGPERYRSGDIIKVRMWDKTAAIVAIGRLRAQAVAQEKGLLELRLKLNGAGDKKGKSAHDFVQIAQRRRKAAAEAAGGGGAPPVPPVPPAT